MLAPPARRAASRARQAKWRERVREGRACYRLDLNCERVVWALIESGRLSEDAALRRSEIERELAAVVEQWADLWLVEKRRRRGITLARQRKQKIP
jgi:hypothetical protein